MVIFNLIIRSHSLIKAGIEEKKMVRPFLQIMFLDGAMIYDQIMASFPMKAEEGRDRKYWVRFGMSCHYSRGQRTYLGLYSPMQ